MTGSDQKHPFRRILIIATITFVAALAVAIYYDVPLPDDSDFLPPSSPAIQPPDNGFPLLGGLHIPFADLTPDDRDIILDPTRPSSTTWDSTYAQQILTDNQRALETLTSALSKEVWHYPHDDFERPIPEFESIRPLCQLKTIAAVHAFEIENTAAGFAHLRDLYEFADRLANMNLGLFGALFQTTATDSIHDTVARIVPDITDNETLSALEHTIAANPPDPADWDHALRSEYASMKPIALHLGRHISDPAQFTSFESLTHKPNTTLHLLLRFYRESASNAHAPNYAARDTTISAKLVEFPRNWTSYITLNFTGISAVADTARSTTNIETHLWRTRFLHIRSRFLIALQQYQLEHGALPKSLTDLTPKYLTRLPPDPYNGAPLRYNPIRPVVWSVGENLTDYGGQPGTSNNRIDWINPTFHIPVPRP